MRFHKLEEFLDTPVGIAFLGKWDVRAHVRHAQKFYLGDVAAVEGISCPPDPRDYPRLPYLLCLFEYQAQDWAGNARTAFMLCMEFIGRPDPPDDFVLLYTFIEGGCDNLGKWWPLLGVVKIDRVANTEACMVSDEAAKGYTGDNPHDLQESLFTSSLLLARFLSVLNCVNTELVEVEEPKTLNKKRLKKGKLPLYSYKTLVLKTRQRKLAAGNGTHESPRVHLRRGHIKRRKTGDFWWQPCVVGNRKKGVVMKEYRADGLVA